MAGIGEASAILGVAQIGLQLAQTLVTVIGDFREAATNINRLRDEIHLTSICLQQLGDLAQKNRLLPGRGVLEATNLRERCRAVIWEIRQIIKKGDEPLRPEAVTKDEIDVSYFMAWKWALWTKKHLEEPRLELDRLKDSLTLTFVTHMAIVGSERERERYKPQIPGIKRNCLWAEEKYRGIARDPSDEDPIPQEVLDAGPEEWDRFIAWKAGGPEPDLKARLVAAGIGKDQISAILAGNGGIASSTTAGRDEVGSPKPVFETWSLDPFAGAVKLSSTDKMDPKDTEKLARKHAQLRPWYKTRLEETIQELNQGMTYGWSLHSLKLVHKTLFRRFENPPTLEVVLKGEPKYTLAQPPPVESRMKIDVPITIDDPQSDNYQSHEPAEAEYMETIPYSEIVPRVALKSGRQADIEETATVKLTDEEIIERQLALYQEEPSAQNMASSS